MKDILILAVVVVAGVVIYEEVKKNQAKSNPSNSGGSWIADLENFFGGGSSSTGNGNGEIGRAHV